MKKINDDTKNTAEQDKDVASEIEKNNSEERDSSKDTKDNVKNAPAEMKGFVRAVPLILWALAIFLAVCFITENTGAFGKFITEFFKGLFSYVAYVIPVLIAIHAIFLKSDLKERRLASRIIFSIITLITLSQLAYIIPNFSAEHIFDGGLFYQNGISGVGGGFVGGAIAVGLIHVFGMPGLIIILCLTVALYATFFFAGKGKGISKFFLRILAAIVNFGARLEKKNEEKKAEKQRLREEKQKKKEQKKNEGRDSEFANDDFFYADNGVSRLEIPELGIIETKDGAAAEAGYILRDSVDKKRNTTESETFDEPVRTNNNLSDTPTFERCDTMEDSYRSDDIIFEAREPLSRTGAANSYGIDESAESVFANDFDPFDLTSNEKRASKKSSRSKSFDTTPSFTEDISNLTPERAEQLRRMAEFEERRREALKRKADKEAAQRAAMENEERERECAEQNARVAAMLEAERLAEAARAAEAMRREEEEREAEAEKLAEAERLAEAVRRAEIERIAEARGENADYYSYTEDTHKSSYEKAGEDLYAEIRKKIEAEMAEEVRQAEEEKRLAEQRRLKEEEDARIKEEERRRIEAEIREQIQAEWAAKNKDTERVVSGATFTSYFPGEADSDEAEDGFIDTTVEKDENDLSFPAYEESGDIYSSSEEKLTVNRSMLESDLRGGAASRFGLDFSDEDEEEEDEDDGELYYEEEDVRKTEIPLAEQNPKINEFKEMFDIFKKNDDVTESLSGDDDSLYDTEEEEYNEEGDFEEENDTPPFDISTAKTMPEGKKKEEKKLPDYTSYRFPPIDLLKKGTAENTEQINEEAQLGAEKLISTLDSFNIAATVRGIERGPRITRYSIVPAKGIRVNQIEKLSDDLAMVLAAESIRIEAPIPGKSAVGIEVPNSTPSIVSLRDLLEAEEFTSNPSKTTVCIGKSVEGSLVYGDISTMPHLLIAGATGMGKSVCMNSLITSILYKARPDEVKFIMIDPKKVEFAPYNGIPHLLVPVVTEPKQAAGALMWAVDEMNKRYDIIEKLCVRGIDSYNEKVSENPELGAPMPKIVIFIDELNDLMIQVRDPVENLIMLIAQKARAAGIHLVIGTQRPSVNVITGVIKANIPSRIACKVSSGVDSRTILETIGAEKLIGKGDMLFAPGGKPNPKRVQGAFVSENETASIVDFVKKQAKGELYDEEAMADMKRAAQKCGNKSKGGDDEGDDEGSSDVGYLHDRKFLNATELAIRNGNVATSFLQRKLGIGYSKAAKYIDIMEDLGIVGEKNGSKPRDVLISMTEWNEKLSRLTSDDDYY